MHVDGLATTGRSRSDSSGARLERPRATRVDIVGFALTAFLAYVPLLLTARGKIAADSKQYLFLDPGRLLSRAPYLWQPEVHLGTVTHQNIGYLFPAGPFFWLLDRVGSPDWVAQRLWLGSILFLAAVGVRFLLRTLAVGGPGPWTAGLVYMLSPYTISYSSRLSVLLLAWAALPWMLAFTVRALGEGGWRWPAAFAITVQVAGSINLTALVFAGVAPVLWILWVTLVERDTTMRRAATTVGRIAVLTVATSLWWLVGLVVQSRYGLDLLAFSETVRIVALGGNAGEVLRGLGNWFFYGGDRLGPWMEATLDYTTDAPLIVAGYALAVLVFVAAALLRWRHRGFFVLLLIVGVVLAVGVHPYEDPSAFGSLLKSASEGSSVGLAMRNVARALPLAILAGSVLVGVAVSAGADWARSRGRTDAGGAVALLVVVLAVLNLPPLWNGGFVGDNLVRPEALPSYWHRAIESLDERGTGTRVLELPGADFAAYTWGNAVEPITPGLTDRPYAARELIPYGSAASANLLRALDRRLQMGLLEPEAIAPIARLLSVGDVVVRSDLQVDRFDIARPGEVQQVFAPLPPGIGGPETFGTGLGELTVPLLDERSLAAPTDRSDAAPVAVHRVVDPTPLVRARTGPGLVVSGDGDGLVDLAALGLLEGDPLVRYSATLSPDPDALGAAMGRDAVLVVTDSNRRRAQRWESLRDSVGYTEAPGESPADDPFDNRLEVFPRTGDEARTVMQPRGARAHASGYGTKHISYLPADRPARALDGDVHTAWRVGRFAPVEGEWLEIRSSEPVTADHLDVVQPLDGDTGRFITQVRLSFHHADGRAVGDDVVVDLGPESRTADGQTITFLRRRFSTVRLTITADNLGPRRYYLSESAVGFAEVRIPGVSAEEVVRMPVDLVGHPGARDRTHPLVYAMTRLRNRVAPPNIAEEESALVREFAVPSSRSFGLAGDARLSNVADDAQVDEVLGYPGPGEGGIAARSSGRIRTTLGARASSALDADPTTSWTSPFGPQVGQWLEVDTGSPVTFDRLDLRLVADGQHSVPTRLRIDAGGQSRVVDVPAVPDGIAPGAAVPAPVRFAPLTGDRIRITVDAVRPVVTREFYSGLPLDAPVAIAEAGIPGVGRAPGPRVVPSTCRDDLVEIDGRPLAVALVGSLADAEAGAPLSVRACADATAAPLALDAGEHVLRAAPGRSTGVDIDRVVLASAAGGGPLTLDRDEAVALAASATDDAPRVVPRERGRTHVAVDVRGATDPFTLVLGQSHNDGWRATVNGHDLGEPQLVDGFANGWTVPASSGETLHVSLRWTPQRWVWIALGLSVAAGLLCIALLVIPRRRDALACPPAPTRHPRLRSPFTRIGAPVPRSVTVMSAVGVTVLGAIVATPAFGLLAGGLTAAVLVARRWRGALGIAAAAAVALTGAYVVAAQERHDFPSVIEWPTFFGRVHALALFAVVLLGADAIVRFVSRSTTDPAVRDAAATESSDPPPDGHSERRP